MMGWPYTPEQAAQQVASGLRSCVACGCALRGSGRIHKSCYVAFIADVEVPPHASDCDYWIEEPCSCAMRFDPDDLADRVKDLT